jgi:citrate lyase subunit beta/citryl-CoA lyase
VANRIFVPHPEEIERARAIVRCFEAEAEKGSTGFVHDQYGFIDEPIYRGAIGLLSTLE